MADGSGGKLCAICGEDVSHKPRTKDPKGHYYCRECYDRARAGHAQHGSAAPKTLAGPRPKPHPHSPALGLEAPLEEPNILNDLIADAPPSQGFTVMPVCPSCGAVLQATAIICNQCGYNLQTHQSVGKVKVHKAPHVASGGVIWPPVVGIISMIYGVCGVLGYGLLFLSALFSGPPSLREKVISISICSLFLSLALWLLRDGWRILKRDSDGVKWIRFWAMTRLLIVGTCMTMAMSVPAKYIDQAIQQGALDSDSSITATDIKSYMLLVFLWFLFWPVFVMVFFFIPRIMKDVEQWD